MSNQVDMFKFYASQLNLSKPQLEAVTDCFKACFEAGENVAKPTAPKKPDETVPSEDRKQHVPFKDNLPWAEETKGAFELPSYMKNRKAKVADMDPEAKRRILGYGQNAVEGNYQNTVNTEEARQMQENEAKRRRYMGWQKLLNKELGLNLAVDGIWGKQTQAAYEEYLARKKNPRVAAGMTREPEQVRTAGPAQGDVTNVNSPLTQVATGNRVPGQARTSGGPSSVNINNVNSPLTQVASGMNRAPAAGVRHYGNRIAPPQPIDWQKAAGTGTNFAYNSPIQNMPTEQNASNFPLKPPTSVGTDWHKQDAGNMTSRYDKWGKVPPTGMTPRG